MIRSQHPAVTYSNLVSIKKLTEQWRLWCPAPGVPQDSRFPLTIDIFSGYRLGPQDPAVGVDESTYADYPRKHVSEEIWFLQCALRELHPDYLGAIWWYIEAPQRTQKDFVELVDLAMVMCLADISFVEDAL